MGEVWLINYMYESENVQYVSETICEEKILSRRIRDLV
jgi:hypothetical protein